MNEPRRAPLGGSFAIVGMDAALIESARELARRPNPVPSRTIWSLAETVLALLVYEYADPARLGGTKQRADGSSSQHAAVLAIARAIGRSPDAVVFKIMNLRSARTDGERGLSRGSRLDRRVVDLFSNDLHGLIAAAYAVAHEVPLAADVFHSLIPPSAARAVGEDTPEYDTDATGRNVLRLRSERVGQPLFRNRVLTNYAYGCAFCGLKSRKPTENSFLLIASHIRPWRDSTPHDRVDPGNGLSLCAIHDRAFDWGFLTVDDTNSAGPRIVASDHARDHYGPPERVGAEILDLHGRSLHHPAKHYQPPRAEHLLHHREQVFERRFRAG